MLLKLNKIKNISISAFSQLMLLMSAPVISRLYSTEQVGIYASILAVGTVIGLNSSLKLDIALISESSDDSHETMAVALFLGVIISIIVGSIWGLTQFSELSSVICLILLSISISLFQNVTYYLTRLDKINYLSKVRVVRSMFISVGQIGFGLYFTTFIILIMSMVIGNVIPIIKQLKFEIVRLDNIVNVLKRNLSYIKYAIPQGLLNSLTMNLPIIFLSISGEFVLAGYYLMAERLLRTPVNFINTSIRQIFLSDFSKSINKFKCYLSWLIPLILLSLLFYLFMYKFSTDIIVFILGSQWRMSAEIVMVLLPWITLSMIQVPATGVLIYLRKMKIYSFVELVDFIIKASLLFFFIDPDDFLSGLGIYSLVGLITYVVIILMSSIIVNKHVSNK
ncbi:oligosaccharide flippase family protein [Moritella marina ATCC 15381]|uniref:Oligosaccharide flippase family protein n=1 Tax=Moritella marina ATCC 15381 TaxID=1202962 RepID=A0A5J6WT62_MORMI|nr:oligosaccharide flippase family protein [Moritella marina]QFI40135.1 oligosaccharide flippase family protein [Moritella marina ATCC 15381]